MVEFTATAWRIDACNDLHISRTKSTHKGFVQTKCDVGWPLGGLRSRQRPPERCGRSIKAAIKWCADKHDIPRVTPRG
jgi:hypothetical protein